jgi:hypothetical protein
MACCRDNFTNSTTKCECPVYSPNPEPVIISHANQEYVTICIHNKCNIGCVSVASNSRGRRWRRHLRAWMHKVRNAQFANAAVTSQGPNHLGARGHWHGHFHMGTDSLIYNFEQEREMIWICVLVFLIIFPQELKPSYVSLLNLWFHYNKV